MLSEYDILEQSSLRAVVRCETNPRLREHMEVFFGRSNIATSARLVWPTLQKYEDFAKPDAECISQSWRVIT
jgi:hypothetical protein